MFLKAFRELFWIIEAHLCTSQVNFSGV